MIDSIASAAHGIAGALDVADLGGFGLAGVPLPAALVVLALIDSLSFGTLLIPIWLLLTPGRVHAGRMAVYLATIVGFYFVVGLIIAFGATTFLSEITSVLATPAARWAQLVLGAGMLVLSFTLSPRKGTEPSRLGRWRARAMGVSDAADEQSEPSTPSMVAHRTLGAGSTDPATAAAAAVVRPLSQRSAHLALMGLALTAAAIEVASMLPYLAGIGLISTSSVGWPGSALLLAGYCVVMVLPALVLLAARVLAADAVEPILRRLGDWLGKHAAESTSWIVGIIGFLLARDAATRLGLFDMLGG